MKAALAAVGSKAKIVHEEYAPQATTDFTAPAQRIFDALKDKPGRKIVVVVWAGAHPLPKLMDLKPERYKIEIAPGGNILPVMAGWKQFPGLEGAIYYYWGFPKNPVNDWLVAEYKKKNNGAPPDFFVAGGMSAAMAIVEAVKKAKSTDTEKLIAAMEGMSFDDAQGHDDLPQGRSPGPAGDVPLAHEEGPAGQRRSARTGARDPGRRDEAADQEQALRRIGAAVETPAPVIPSMLETQDLTIRFGGHAAVDGVSCAFEKGTLTSIVGPNGAGKTTYFNLISGQLPATSGRVKLNGEDITGYAAPRRTRLGLGRAFQLTNLFPNLSALENVRLAVQVKSGKALDLLQPRARPIAN